MTEAADAARIIGDILKSVISTTTSTTTPTGQDYGVDVSQPAGTPGTPTDTGSPIEGTNANNFGQQRETHVHEGTDIGAPVGTIVHAATAGTITRAGTDAGGYGTWIEIQGPNNVSTRYAHLSAMTVQAGDEVTMGQQIGLSGGAPGAPGAGNSQGPHLHFEVRVGGKPIDPAELLVGTGPLLTAGDAEQAANLAPEVLATQSENQKLGTAVGDVMESLTAKEPITRERASDTATAAVAGATGEGGDAESWIRTAMQITGVDESWYPGLKRQMMQESGGRNVPQAITDENTTRGTPAFGPMQVIEPTFNSYKMPGYENWKDPLHNTIAAIRYIQSRYGHPKNLTAGEGY